MSIVLIKSYLGLLSSSYNNGGGWVVLQCVEVVYEIEFDFEGHSTKGKSRRIIFKKSATRAPGAVARAVTSDRVYYKGQYFTKGDIVSVEDMDGSVYYAQLRGFLTDQYCEKSGVITWLLPTTHRE